MHQRMLFLLKYFCIFDESKSMLAVIRMTHIVHSSPEVLRTQYMGNMFMCNMCKHPCWIRPPWFIEVLHGAAYHFEMKGEPLGPFVDRWDTQLHTQRGSPHGQVATR